jgi:hypothetical protein
MINDDRQLSRTGVKEGERERKYKHMNAYTHTHVHTYAQTRIANTHI